MHPEGPASMYESYWGLSESPFLNTLDERWYFESTQHDEALARLYYLVEHRRQCGLLTGIGGTGKSLLLAILANQVRRTQRQAVWLDLLGLSGGELLWQVASQLNLAPIEGAPLSVLWRAVRDQLHALRLSQLQTVILVDRLDRADDDCAQMLERLLQLDQGPSCWVTLVAATRSPALRGSSAGLLERSDLRVELIPWTPADTSEYVRSALRRAGCDRELLDDEALQAVFECSRGIPRNVNRVCDLSLLAAMGQPVDTIDAATVHAASEELQGPVEVAAVYGPRRTAVVH